MPIYAMYCHSCQHEEDIYRSIAKMDDDLPKCCGSTMQRRIVAPMISDDIQPYKSMCDGSWITSRSQHRAHLKQHKVIEVGNEKIQVPKKQVAAPAGLKDTLIRVANDKLK